MSADTVVGKQSIYRADWGDTPDIQRWLRKEMFVGETLNFPCGASLIGDVRADVDTSHNPDIVADLHNLPFKERSFDTVYCDPPYHFYGGKQYHFVNPLWDLARERIIFQTNKVALRIGKTDKRIFALEKPGAQSLLLFQVFDRKDHDLNDFNE